MSVNSNLREPSKVFNSANIAFVIVVCTAYASAAPGFLYVGRSLRPWEIAMLVLTGAAYLVIGTYGFAFCRRSESRLVVAGYFATQILLASTFVLVRGSVRQLALILPLAGQSALLLPMRGIITVCTLIYATLIVPSIWHGLWPETVEHALVYGTGIVFVVVFTRIAASERDARAQLAEANQHLREHASQVEELATTKERNRLAREIHDSLGHYLTVVNVQIGAAQAVLEQDRPRALDHLSKAQSLTQEGLAEVRRSVAALRASPIESRPLPEALAKLVEQWIAAGLHTKLEVAGIGRPLTPQASLTLYRATQEALTNAGKHAQATRVDLQLDYRKEGFVRLSVKDNGVGSDTYEGGFGLLGVRERVQLLNGVVKVNTKPGKGFSLEVELPT